MVKYLRKYRIYCEWDRRNLEPIKEDTYDIQNNKL